MAAIKCCALGLVVWLAASAGSLGASKVELREAPRTGEATRVRVELKADGQFLPASPPGAEAAAKSKGEKPRALALKVEAQLEFVERLTGVDSRGRPTRGVRRVLRAASAINGEVRPSAAVVRPEVALLVAEPRAGGVVVFSPGGPLTREELELVQGPADPLEFAGLLPEGPVAVGDHWPVGDSAARSLSQYDALTSQTLVATLEEADAGSARVRLRGEIRGSVLGGEGSMACDGTFTFDRKAGRVDRLVLRRAEARRPGPVEAGLDVKSTLSVSRTGAETPAELADDALSALSLEPSPDRERLLLVAPGGRYTLEHDRGWHKYWDDPRLTVLKRVESGRAVAQCNLAAGPNAGRGRHQDPDRFRDDIRKSLGDRFVQLLGTGEVDGDPAGGYRYKVGVQGRQGDLGVVWYYYLIAGPAGDQIVATFTLAETEVAGFGNRDEALIGTLRWK
jgi:hypothetical protein